MGSLEIFMYSLITLLIISSPVEGLYCNCRDIKCESITCQKDYVQTPNIAGLCSCCDGCVQFNKQLDDECITNAQPIQQTGDTFHFISQDCPPNLICKNGYCEERFTAPCNVRLDEYKPDFVGGKPPNWYWQPECNADGTFKPKQCKRNKCFCVDENGMRFRGTFTKDHADDTDCKCPVTELKLRKLKTIGLYDHMVCQSNGNFEALQCLQDMCFCVNVTTGKITDTIVPKTLKHLLSCYDEEAFKTIRNQPCQIQREYEERLASYYINKGMPTRYLHPIECNPDGSYIAKQCTNDHCFCVNPLSGKKIGEDVVQIRSILEQEMNCQCQLDYSEVSADGGHSQSFDCAKNGNYKKSKCHENVCYCVDTDGYKDSDDLNVKPFAENYCKINNTRIQECYTKANEINCS